ncbi:MAG: GH36-type glycosyl hydrolase domain-containing protein [Promethearchaeota archaeon]
MVNKYKNKNIYGDNSYGSGYFGEWIEDEFGLPAYRYTCDQINDPKAISPVTEEWGPNTDHKFEVGNDRLVGVASNYGYIRVRQDEGSPKFLNDYDPANNLYAGGFGYLTDGSKFLSTYYSGKAQSFERIFGVGYFRKIVKDLGLIADQIVFAPFGDDPLLISQVTITNERNDPVNLRWIEYWASQMYQFSMKSVMLSALNKKKSSSDIRREFSRRFLHDFSKIPGDSGFSGILDLQKFKGNKNSTKLAWKALKAILQKRYENITGGAVESSVEEAVYEDTDPSPIFFTSIDAPAESLTTDISNFFGNGGAESPEGLNDDFAFEFTPSKSDTGMLIERKLELKPGENKTLFFAYGYLPEGFEIKSLLLKYEKNLSKLLSKSCELWKKERISLKLTEEKDKWVDRELLWHNYYLRANLTYDSFFKEHILSQGHVYQYLIGFQGAARDPLQHALPFIYSNPKIVKEIIRYTLKEVTFDGEIPYGITGCGHIMPAPFKPSDQELWLLWLASEYVLGNRDKKFLEEIIPLYPIYSTDVRKASVKDLLYICYEHFIKITGVGRHGLQRLSNGDWNDAAVIGYVKEENHEIVRQSGESVLNAAMAAYVLKLYSKLLNYLGEDKKSKKTLEKAENQRLAVIKQWNGKWFKRAWLTEELGWIGDDEIWLEPQPWAIISGATDREQTKTLLQNIDEKLRKPSPIGVMIRDNLDEKVPGDPGMGTNAGIWPSINGTVIQALALVNGEMAWDEWQKNTLAVHAESYPDVWYGIWSGPDTYNSEISSEFPGQTIIVKQDTKKSTGMNTGVQWVDFPVLNMHPHAWPLYNIINLIGIQFTGYGIIFKPLFPKDEYEFKSPLIGFKKSKSGYSGWYFPKIGGGGNWKITLLLSEDEIKSISAIKINGKEEKPVIDGNKVEWAGESTPDQPLRWELIM